MTEDVDNLIVTKENAEVRLDKFLSSHFDDRSRSYFQYLIESGNVLLNGEKAKKKRLTKENDEIEIFFIATEELSLEPENIPLDIIFEDEHLLVINKPQNMVVHPAQGNWSHTLVNALLYYCKNLPKKEENDLRPGIVHRLDKDTSGVIIAAKTEKAQRNLVEQFQQRVIHKRYLAITYGKPIEGIFSSAIARHPKLRQQMALVHSGKEAITGIKILDSNENFSLIEASPKTGRTHQIRLHLKALQAPILGDPLYGNLSINKQYGVEKQLLHAYQIEFAHPVSKEKLHFTAPLPQVMKDFLQKLKLGQKGVFKTFDL